MNIYQSVEEYAKQTNTTAEQAKLRCEYFLMLQKQAELKNVCPNCKQATLVFEGGCSEIGHGEYIYCENEEFPYTVDGEEVMGDCEFITNETEAYEEIMPYFDFDVVLVMASDIKRLKQEDKQIELSLGQNWQEFVEKENLDILKEMKKSNIGTN